MKAIVIGTGKHWVRREEDVGGEGTRGRVCRAQVR